MFRVSMFPEVVLVVVLLLGGSQVGVVDTGAASNPNVRQASTDDLGGLLLADGKQGAHIDPNGGRGNLTVDPEGFARTDSTS